MPGLGGFWNPNEHPRGWHGRFAKKWKVSDALQKLFNEFSPRTFQSDSQAGQYAFNQGHKNGPFSSTELTRLRKDWDEAQDHIRAGDMDPQTKAFDDMMQAHMRPAPEGLIATTTFGPDALGLRPDQLHDGPGGITDLFGTVLGNKGYQAVHLGTDVQAGQHGPGKISATIMVPQGTKVAFPGQSPNDRGFFLDKEQPLLITRIDPDGMGGWRIAAVAEPHPGMGGSQVSQDLNPGRKGVGLTPEERAARLAQPSTMPAQPTPPSAPATEATIPPTSVQAPAVGRTAQQEAARVQRAQAGRQANVNEGNPPVQAPLPTPNPREAPPAPAAPTAAPGGVPARNEPIHAPSIGATGSEGKSASEIAQTPTPAPEAPPVLSPAEQGKSLKDAYMESGIQSPSAGNRRGAFNRAYLNAKRTGGHPEQALRDLETDIAHAQQGLDSGQDTTPHLAEDIKSMNDLADLISTHFGVPRAKKEEPAPTSPVQRTGAPDTFLEAPKTPGARAAKKVSGQPSKSTTGLTPAEQGGTGPGTAGVGGRKTMEERKSPGTAAGKITHGRIEPGDHVLVRQNDKGEWVPTTTKTGATPLEVTGREGASLVGKGPNGEDIKTRGERGHQTFLQHVEKAAKAPAVKKAAKAATPSAPAAKKAAKAVPEPTPAGTLAERVHQAAGIPEGGAGRSTIDKMLQEGDHNNPELLRERATRLHKSADTMRSSGRGKENADKLDAAAKEFDAEAARLEKGPAKAAKKAAAPEKATKGLAPKVELSPAERDVVRNLAPADQSIYHRARASGETHEQAMATVAAGATPVPAKAVKKAAKAAPEIPVVEKGTGRHIGTPTEARAAAKKAAKAAVPAPAAPTPEAAAAAELRKRADDAGLPNTVAELKALAKEKKIRGFSTMNKEKLTRALLGEEVPKATKIGVVSPERLIPHLQAASSDNEARKLLENHTLADLRKLATEGGGEKLPAKVTKEQALVEVLRRTRGEASTAGGQPHPLTLTGQLAEAKLVIPEGEAGDHIRAAIRNAHEDDPASLRKQRDHLEELALINRRNGDMPASHAAQSAADELGMRAQVISGVEENPPSPDAVAKRLAAQTGEKLPTKAAVAKAAKKAVPEGPKPLEKMLKTELMSEAQTRGIDARPSWTKSKLQEEITRHDRLKRGETPADVQRQAMEAASAAAPTPGAVDTKAREAEVVARIAAAHDELVHRPGGFTNLSALRDKVGSDVSRAEFDRAITDISRTGLASVVPESNQKVMTPEIRAGAVQLGNQDRHLLSLRPGTTAADLQTDIAHAQGGGHPDQGPARARQIAEERKLFGRKAARPSVPIASEPRANEFTKAWDAAGIPEAPGSAGRSIKEIRKDLAEGKIDPAEGVRRMESEISFNKDELSQVEADLRAPDLTDKQRADLQAEHAKISEGIKAQEKASEFLRGHFGGKGDKPTVEEVKVHLPATFGDHLKTAKPEEMDEVARIQGLDAPKGDTAEEKFNDLIRQTIDQALDEKKKAGAEKAAKAESRRLAKEAREAGKAEFRPGGAKHLDAAKIAEGLDMGGGNSYISDAQAELNDGKTPKQVADRLRFLARGLSDSNAIIHGSAIAGSETPDDKMHRETKLAQGREAVAKLTELADRIEASKRPRAPRTPSTKLAPSDHAVAKEAAKATGTPVAEVRSAMEDAKKADAKLQELGIPTSTDELHVRISERVSKPFNDATTRAEMEQAAHDVRTSLTIAEIRAMAAPHGINGKSKDEILKKLVSRRFPGPRTESMGQAGLERARAAQAAAKEGGRLTGGQFDQLKPGDSIDVHLGGTKTRRDTVTRVEPNGTLHTKGGYKYGPGSDVQVSKAESAPAAAPVDRAARLAAAKAGAKKAGPAAEPMLSPEAEKARREKEVADNLARLDAARAIPVKKAAKAAVPPAIPSGQLPTLDEAVQQAQQALSAKGYKDLKAMSEVAFHNAGFTRPPHDTPKNKATNRALDRLTELGYIREVENKDPQHAGRRMFEMTDLGRLAAGQELRGTTAKAVPAKKAAKAAPSEAPIEAGKFSDKPFREQTWGGAAKPNDVRFHEDGEIGLALSRMGQDQRLDVGGEPLRNVLGQIATEVNRGTITPAQGLERYKALAARLPEGSKAKDTLESAIKQIDAPVRKPNLPEGTPDFLRKLADQLAEIPIARKATPRSGRAGELDQVEALARELTDGKPKSIFTAREALDKMMQSRHESASDAGYGQIQAAIRDAIKADEVARTAARKARAKAAEAGPKAEGGPAAIRVPTSHQPSESLAKKAARAVLSRTKSGRAALDKLEGGHQHMEEALRTIRSTPVRPALSMARSSHEVGDVLAREAKHITGQDLRVNLDGVHEDVARGFAEGILQGLEAHPHADLKAVLWGTEATPGRPVGQWTAYMQPSDQSIVIRATDTWHQILHHFSDRGANEHGIRSAVARTPQGVGKHEFGHILTHGPHHGQLMQEAIDVALAHYKSYGLRSSPSFQAFVSREVSAYGWTNSDELLAEAYVDVETHGRRASPLSQDLYRLILAHNPGR